jgi:hypothetical protein
MIERLGTLFGHHAKRFCWSVLPPSSPCDDSQDSNKAFEG